MTAARTASALLALAGLALAGEALAINKCVDKAGKVSYQEDRCPDDAKADVIKVAPAPDAPPAPPVATGAAPAKGGADEPDDPRLQDLAATQAAYEGCTFSAPDFAQRNGVAYEAWRKSRSELFAKLEGSQKYQAQLEDGRKKARSQIATIPGAREKMVAFCEEQFMPSLKAKTPK